MSELNNDDLIKTLTAGVTEALLTRMETVGGKTILYTDKRVRRELLDAIQSGVVAFLEKNKDQIISAVARSHVARDSVTN